MTKRIARLLSALMIVVLVAAACGDDDDTPVSAGDGAAASDDGGGEDGDCAADGEDCMQMVDDKSEDMDDMDMEDGEQGHSHGDVLEVPEGMAVPEISIEVTPDPMSGQNLQVSLANFTISAESASTDPVDGEGHLHLYVDGERVMRFYNEWVHLKLGPGERMVEVEVSANNHSPYGVDGEPIRAKAMVTVPESDGHSHGHDDVVEVDAAAAPTVSVEVIKDPKSGWNVHATIDNFTITPENASSDHVDGEGHLHLYVDGERVTRLYGEWWHIKSLSEGDHEVAVEVSANDHRPYAVDGEPIVGIATVTVAADEASGDGHDDEGDHDHADDEDEGDHEDDGDHDHDHGDGDGEAMTDMGAADADLTVTVDFTDGEVTVDDDRISVERGSVVALVVTSDADEHIHVHGFDLFGDVLAGETATLVFTADVPGVFEIEFEDSFTFITELEVR